MKSLIVEQAANGFIVRDGFRSGLEFGPARDAVSVPHVFETFEALTAHLKQELTPPLTAHPKQELTPPLTAGEVGRAKVDQVLARL